MAKGNTSISWEGTGPVGTSARTTYSLTDDNGGTRFAYESEFRPARFEQLAEG